MDSTWSFIALMPLACCTGAEIATSKMGWGASPITLPERGDPGRGDLKKHNENKGRDLGGDLGGDLGRDLGQDLGRGG